MMNAHTHARTHIHRKRFRHTYSQQVPRTLTCSRQLVGLAACAFYNSNNRTIESLVNMSNTRILYIYIHLLNTLLFALGLSPVTPVQLYPFLMHAAVLIRRPVSEPQCSFLTKNAPFRRRPHVVCLTFPSFSLAFPHLAFLSLCVPLPFHLVAAPFESPLGYFGR